MLARPLVRSVVSPLVRGVTERGRRGVDMAALRTAVAAMAPKAWYERGALDTVFQDATGVPASSNAAVAIGLSKDQALAYGPELHVPDTSSPAWNAGLGRFVMSRSAAGVLVAYATNVNLTPGRMYRVELDAYQDGGAVPHVTEFRAAVTGLSFPLPLQVSITSSGQRVAGYLMAPASAGVLNLWGGATSNGNVWGASNISIREVLGNHQIQGTSTARPLYQVAPKRVVFDGIDDVLTTVFSAALGASCTVVRAIPGTGAVITEGVNIGTTFPDNVTASALVIFPRALTTAEKSVLTAYLNQLLA